MASFDRCRQASLFASCGSLPPTTLPLVSPSDSVLITDREPCAQAAPAASWPLMGSAWLAAAWSWGSIMPEVFEGETVPRPVLRHWG